LQLPDYYMGFAQKLKTRNGSDVRKRKGLPSDVRKSVTFREEPITILGMPSGAKPPKNQLAGRAEPCRTSEGKPFLLRTSDPLCTLLRFLRLRAFATVGIRNYNAPNFGQP
jgi:hypothetical protein